MVSALQCRFLICTLKFHFIYSDASYTHWLTKCILRPFDILSCSFVNRYSTFKIRIKALLFTFLFCFVFTSTQEMVQAITIPSSTVTGDIAQPLWTAVWRLIKKLTTHLPVDPANHNPRELKTCPQKPLYKNVQSNLLIIAKISLDVHQQKNE